MSTASQDVRDRADAVRTYYGNSERAAALAVAACALVLAALLHEETEVERARKAGL